MSRRNKKNKKKYTVNCPLCIDNGKVTPLVVKKISYEVGYHHLVLKKQTLSVDFSRNIQDKVGKTKFILCCPTCEFKQEYPTLKEIYDTIYPYLDICIVSARNSFDFPKQNTPKQSSTTEDLPKIIRPTAHAEIAAG